MSGKEIVGRLKRFVDKLNGDNMTVDEAIAWAKAWPDTSNGLSEDSLAALVLANEVERLHKESKENAKDADRLNEMLRQTGYGQGSIDAYVAQCEELDRLKDENERLARELEGWKSLANSLRGDSLFMRHGEWVKHFGATPYKITGDGE